MRKLFIWWHRRRAQAHAAAAASDSGSWKGTSSFYYKSWSEWHTKQVERLEK